MALRERLIYAIEVVSDKAQAGLKGFRSSVSEAEGATGKLKAGAASAFASVQANAGTLALAGGAALVGFGAKAISTFQDTALAAGKFADATGLAVEDASRLNEVAGDVGVSADTISGAIARMNKAASSGDLAKFGIDIQKTADGATDVNGTFLETVRVINSMEDPIDRAAAAQAIFGRGYKEAAEVIFQSADGLKAKLDDVSDSKVISQEELKKARDYREALDNLKDVSEDLAISVGQDLVPVVTDLANSLKDVSEISSDLKIPELLRFGIENTALHRLSQLKDLLSNRGSDGMERSLRGAIEAAAGIAPATGAAADGIDDLGDAADGVVPKIQNVDQAWRDFVGSLSVADAAPGTFEDMKAAADAAIPSLEELADVAEDKAAAALDTLAAAAKGVGDAIDGAFKEARDQIDFGDLLDDITDDFGKVKEAADKLTEDGEQGQRNYNRSVRDTQRDILKLLDSIDDIPPDKKVAIAAEISRAGIDELFQILAELTKGVVVPVSFAPNQQKAFTGVDVSFDPTSGSISGPIFSGVNPAPNTILNQTINYPIGSTPTTTTQNLQTYTRWNGPR